MKQVDKEAYAFERYVGADRWASYYYQLREIMACKPVSVLEVGVGDGVVGNYLKKRAISYSTVDIAEDLCPDVVASVTSLPFPDDSFDVVCAFEVLEHLPFSEFQTALNELVRVARHTVLLSLPHFGPSVRLECKIPFLPLIRIAFKIPYPQRHVFNGQHHWEIGKRSYPVRRIRSIIAEHGIIVREFVPFENQYHHFFVLKKHDRSK